MGYCTICNTNYTGGFGAHQNDIYHKSAAEARELDNILKKRKDTFDNAFNRSLLNTPLPNTPGEKLFRNLAAAAAGEEALNAPKPLPLPLGSGSASSSREIRCPDAGCAKLFPNNHSLKRHIEEVHEKTRPFECYYCDLAFARKEHLNRHITAVHNKERQFTCPMCDSAFSQRNNLNRHIQVVHNHQSPPQPGGTNSGSSSLHRTSSHHPPTQPRQPGGTNSGSNSSSLHRRSSHHNGGSNHQQGSSSAADANRGPRGRGGALPPLPSDLRGGHSSSRGKR